MKRSDRVQQELEWMEGLIARMEAIVADCDRLGEKLDRELANLQKTEV